MKTHTLHGIDIIKQSSWLKEASEVVRYHHEKFDGKGYMDGLSGESIPVNARIFAIVDVFDALTSVRPYKQALSSTTALEIMKNDSGTHFDPNFLAVFFQIASALHEKCHNSSDENLASDLALLTKKYF
jgi:HD-GYP domain-containing protein (c-di-GMP phosphodiesterase class II)